MTLYNTSPFSPPARLVTAGRVHYLFGSRSQTQAPTKLLVTAVASTSTVLTFYVLINEGNIPAVGNSLTVYGTVTNSQFNVTNATIASVTITASTGIGTITVSGTSLTVVSKTADAGEGLISVPEVPDVTDTTSASAPCQLAFDENKQDLRTIFCEALWSGTMPTSATVSLQVANVDQDSRYITVGTINTVAGSAVSQQGAQFSLSNQGAFYRAKITAISGGDGTTGLVCTLVA